MEKIFGVVILYNPAEEVIGNITGYLPFLRELMIIDNSEPASKLDFSNYGDNVTVLRDGTNQGISARLNQAARYAIDKQADWLLTMDQDSFFSGDYLKQYIECLSSFSDKEKVAMCGVSFESVPSTNDCAIAETANLITSGSILNLDIFKKIGSFDENLFIDEVDFEYCARAMKNGYKTIQFTNIYLNHSLGTVSQHRSIKSLKKTTRTLHSPLRLYYMLRNYLYVCDRYQAECGETLKLKRTALLNRIKNNLLYGNNRVKILRYLVMAVNHYKAGKMGKLSN
ncbi:glycosyltransferase [Niabella sp. CJ426]|uniref:glycosyltransferase n=1 Tax=Niabella sp. CJ426 TaxID=3393740 RepID=UPI003CFC3B9E